MSLATPTTGTAPAGSCSILPIGSCRGQNALARLCDTMTADASDSLNSRPRTMGTPSVSKKPADAV